jgi:hypothetical protein
MTTRKNVKLTFAHKVVNYKAWGKNYDPIIPAVHAKDSWLMLGMDAYIL